MFRLGNCPGTCRGPRLEIEAMRHIDTRILDRFCAPERDQQSLRTWARTATPDQLFRTAVRFGTASADLADHCNQRLALGLGRLTHTGRDVSADHPWLTQLIGCLDFQFDRLAHGWDIIQQLTPRDHPRHHHAVALMLSSWRVANTCRCVMDHVWREVEPRLRSGESPTPYTHSATLLQFIQRYEDHNIRTAQGTVLRAAHARRELAEHSMTAFEQASVAHTRRGRTHRFRIPREAAAAIRIAGVVSFPLPQAAHETLWWDGLLRFLRWRHRFTFSPTMIDLELRMPSVAGTILPSHASPI